MTTSSSRSEFSANLSLVPMIDQRLMPTKGEMARSGMASRFIAASYRKEGPPSLKQRIGTLLGHWFA